MLPSAVHPLWGVAMSDDIDSPPGDDEALTSATGMSTQGAPQFAWSTEDEAADEDETEQRSDAGPMRSTDEDLERLMDDQAVQQSWWSTWGYAAIVIACAAAVANIILFAVLMHRGPPTTLPPPRTGISSTSPAPALAPQPPSSPTTSAAPVALPNVPPPNSGCQGVVIAHSDLEHPALGTIRVFLFLDRSAQGMQSAGCILPVTTAGRVLPSIPIDGQDKLGFANPATDATGNTFVIYDPGRYDGVLVLIPNADGFEDIGWNKDMSGTHYVGKHAYYYAELVGPNSSDIYTIRQSHNDCTPSCAEGTTTSHDLHWNGSDYVP
jgi:hypothetical protein